ncbi:MAG: glycosyltransferase [Verrucomicrobiae bacterium]|nr:glycosyltransferase [Verrucomicrobiae bacterium]NNJ43704.1 glycosyltransferase family 4 protein [Akkermansiaceae bacterium]
MFQFHLPYIQIRLSVGQKYERLPELIRESEVRPFTKLSFVPKKINIIARTNGVGLDRDVDLIHSALTAAGFEVTVSHCRGISPLRTLFPGTPRFDANIFLERVFPRWFGTAKTNLLIPNQERFPHRHLKHLRHIDHILCKSRHAEEIFQGLGYSTHFTAFTSSDLLDASIEPDYQSFFHLAGRSTLKGTETILKLWKKHPEWPTLTVVQCKENAPESVPKNVCLVTDYIPHEEIKALLNSHGVHLCTSLSEGWGHYIVEAMSCRAVVVTTDAPPMNELITPARGIPVPYHHSEPRHLGTNFHIDPDKLEKNIQDLLLMTPEQKQSYGAHARLWFEENDREFRQNLPQVITPLVRS